MVELIGADPDQLDRTAAHLERTAQRIGSIHPDVARALATSSWDGPDADDYRDRWRTRGRTILDHTVDLLNAAATTLHHNAADQRHTSAADTASTSGPGAGGPGGPGGPPAGPTVDRAKVDDALASVRSNLDPGGWGVRQDDLDRIRESLARLNGPEADAVLAGLTDEELQRWYDAMGDSWLKGGWPEDRIRELETMLGEKVSLDTWNRLATHSNGRINPPTTGDLADTANPDPARAHGYEQLRYRRVDGPLTTGGGNGYQMGDANQGSIGDCYLIAGMQALALRDPEALRRMVQANPNGTYTVTFADGSKTVVSPEYPAETDGRPAFAKANPNGAEVWPMVIEKAYAQRHGGWAPIVGGNQDKAIEQLTGHPASWVDGDDASIADLADRWDRGEILGLSTIDAPSQDLESIKRWRAEQAPEPYRRGRYHQLEQNHAFVVTGIDRARGTVTVVNPWYPTAGEVVLTESELRASINGVYVNETR